MKLTTLQDNHTHYHYITTKQFKKRIITIYFLTDLKDPNITARSLMFQMLGAKNAKYPTRRSQNQYLESLYDAIFDVRSIKIGTQHVNRLTFITIDDAFTDDALFDQALDFIRTALYNPQFDAVTLNEEKTFLKDYFKAEYTNKTRYARKRYYETLLEDYPYNMNALGDETRIDEITLKDIQESYQTMLHHNTVVITVTGNITKADIHDTLKSHLPITSTPTTPEMIYRHDFTKKEPLKETHDVSQARLFMTLKTDIYFRDSNYFIVLVFNTLFGEGTDSMLFKEVREAQSLAYYIYSNYSPFTGLISIFSGMADHNVAQGERTVLECLTKVKTGAFNDEDLTLAKTHLKSAVKQGYDSMGNLSLKALRSSLFNVPFEKSHILEAINNVTKSDVITLANTIEPTYTYILGGEHDED
ncbi:MAG: EF-P 5-aminopentanol modification-associated protein YfmF [Bacillota bacterium]